MCQWCGSDDHDGPLCPRVEAFTFHPDGSVAGVAFRPDAADPGSPVLDFLSGVDPGHLDSEVQAELELHEGTYGELTVRVLKRWAGGD